ncbi:cysteine synthase family protein [Streptomyces cinnamoneus]|uniref:2,3-diaminopropionate biosynthesis protein SbnA n=1 Tax=Streptomyces cinnamoneus TaxID=53446 RepID=A0A918WG45_STRCJ|nr:cysteine synthase family protein [Streptomyces cinnamoneus]GHC43868.1 2,3-diaminopropionate biosynthesis protein SbnA [Streptomyces cinnamoneus]
MSPIPPPVTAATTDPTNPVLDYVRRAVADYPVVPVRTVRTEIAGIPRTITLKLEGHSPWRSVKGRTALSLIRSVAGELTVPGATVVESTSGNLGLALSAICRDLGLRFIAVVDQRQSPVIQKTIEDNGGELDWVKTPDDAATHLQDRLARVRELVRDLPHAVWPNQYENEANWRVHESWTAPELDAQAGASAQALFAGVSTGGTLAGLSRYFRRARPDLRIVAVDVRGSTVFGGVPRPRALTGIGASRRSAFLDDTDCDAVLLVEERRAVACCHTLREDTGIAVGGSSGAVLAGALDYLYRHPEVRHALCLCPDLGDNYAPTVYHPAWLDRIGLPADAGRLRHRTGAACPGFRAGAAGHTGTTGSTAEAAARTAPSEEDVPR